jgi:hypothetical protein
VAVAPPSAPPVFPPAAVPGFYGSTGAAAVVGLIIFPGTATKAEL